MRFIYTFFAAFLMQTLSTAATANDLISIVKTNEGSETKIKFSSITFAKNKGGDSFTSAIFQNYIKTSDKLFINERYVLDKDCERGYGKVFALDTDGKFIYNSEFVLGGESVASIVAKTLCLAYEKQKIKNDKLNQQPDAETKWRDTIDEFIQTEAIKPNGIDYRRDTDKQKMLDGLVKQLANDPKNVDKPMLWFLVEADRLVKQQPSRKQ